MGESAPAIIDSFSWLLPSQRLGAHFEVATGALVAGLTNVITIRPDGLATGYTTEAGD
ncbi:MAG: hypothetical protein ACI8W8_002963 [Rhodothermales bacterium]|jgi:hypothetical protein